MTKIVFVLPVQSAVHCYKRIRCLQDLGVETDIYSFERDYYPSKLRPAEYVSLGSISHGRYYKRLVPLARAMTTIRKAAESADVVYAFGLDILLQAFLATRGLSRAPKLVYEATDIRSILTQQTPQSVALRWLERFLLRRVHLLVVTSEAFVSGYYQGVQGVQVPYLVIENKLMAEAMPVFTPVSRPNDGVLRIGYFGHIRCRASWEVLKEVARVSEGRVQVQVAGILNDIATAQVDLAATPGMIYRGSFVSPDDLPALYSQVDVSWAAHFHGINNTKWARGNRFYEGCYFQKPMFAQIGTVDGEVVASKGLGVCLDLADKDACVQTVLSTRFSDLDQWRQNIAALPRNMYVLTDEHKRLLEGLR